MKATELRIGNLVDTIYGVQSVIGIDTSDERGEYVIFNDGRKFGHYIEHDGELLVKPIPLTDEWLNAANGTSFDDELSMTIWCDNRGVYLEQYGEGRMLLSHIKYVHQLQNLYFALTGTELELRK